jgi:hypothetical protein
MTGVATGIVLATILHYFMNMHMSTRLIELGWWKIITAWIPGIVLGAVCLLISWTIHIVTAALGWPGYLVLIAATILIPATMLCTIYLFPTILGNKETNPLVYLPGRIKQIAVVSNLLERLK